MPAWGSLVHTGQRWFCICIVFWCSCTPRKLPVRFFGKERTAIHPYKGIVPASVLRYTQDCGKAQVLYLHEVFWYRQDSGKAQVLYLHGVLWTRQDTGTPIYRYCTSIVLRYTQDSGKAQVLYLHWVLWYRKDSGTTIYCIVGYNAFNNLVLPGRWWLQY